MVMSHYKNSRVLCPCECINSSDEWSLLQILWWSLGWSFWRGRIEGQEVRFPLSLIHSPWLALCCHCGLFLRKVNIRKESSIGTGSTSFKVSPSHHYPGPRGFSWFFFAKEIKSKPRSVLKYSVYSVFCFRIFCKFRLSVYSVFQNIPCIPPFRSVLPTVRQPPHRVTHSLIEDVWRTNVCLA